MAESIIHPMIYPVLEERKKNYKKVFVFFHFFEI